MSFVWKVCSICTRIFHFFFYQSKLDTNIISMFFICNLYVLLLVVSLFSHGIWNLPFILSLKGFSSLTIKFLFNSTYLLRASSPTIKKHFK